MADPKIPLADLPYGLPGAFDRVAGVDTSTGAAKQFPMPQAGEPKDYQTRASLPSASGLPDGTSAHVNNDPNPDNNGRWAVFGGQWVQSADRVTSLERTTERIVEASSKNLFDPQAVINGLYYRSNGEPRPNSGYRVTPKYPVEAGDVVSISGMTPMLSSGVDRHVNFWDGNSHVGAVGYPAANIGTDWMRVDVPDGATSFSLNLNPTSSPLPPRLQIEIAPRPTEYEPRRRTATALPEALFQEFHYERSQKNLFDGAIHPRNVTDSLVSAYGGLDRLATSFVPVEQGKTYTISGLDPELIAPANRRVVGTSDPKSFPVPVTEVFETYDDPTHTITITNPSTKFIVVMVAHGSLYERAHNLSIQVEEGAEATSYEPYLRVRGAESLLTPLEEEIDALRSVTANHVSAPLDQLNSAGPLVEAVAPSRYFGPFGAQYSVAAEPGNDSVGSVLFAKVKNVLPGRRSLYGFIHTLNAEGQNTLPKLSVSRFDVPSGQLLYDPPSANFSATFPADDYVHPSIAYDPAGVAGYKYWMVASIFPPYATGGANWEDEDIFVSNDAKSWLRIKSLYEPAQDHHAPGLSLPPHSLVASGGRRHAFLPCPSAGDTIEVSAPESEWGPALDRENITLSGTPWKHDPAILMHGGYVYIYHTFHLSYDARDGGKNKFIVCTRTNDGVNWECVRSDGSTLPLTTAAASRQMFTKDGAGRFNFLFYALSGQNPEVIKYGVSDFEFIYGANFSTRFAGSTPWNFDFTNPLPMNAPSSGNHPGLMLAGGTLYMLSDQGAHTSTDRGVTFSELDHYPAWRGGFGGSMYKKALCLGEGGKVLVADVYSGRVSGQSKPAGDQFIQTQRRNMILMQEYGSVAQFLDLAQSGLGDGYVDVQVDAVNERVISRRSEFVPYIGNVSTTTGVNSPMQRVKLVEIDVARGDVLYIYISLNARSGGRVSFNGLEIE